MDSSLEMQIDNGGSIPYHDGLFLGNGVDVTKQLTGGRKLVADGLLPTVSKIDSLSCKFCLANKFVQVCETLDIPHEYALKVESGLVHNEVVKTCLHDIYNTQAFKVIFRLRYIWELQEYTSPITLNAEGGSLPTSDNNGDGPGGATSDGDGRAATHVVKALYTGDELVLVMTISASESDALQTFYNKIEQILGGRQGCMGKESMVATFEKLGESLDAKLSKSHHKNVGCVIQYGSYCDLISNPRTVSGMAHVVKVVTQKWLSTKDADLKDLVTGIKVATGNDNEESTTVKQSQSDKLDVYKLRASLQPTSGNGTQQVTEDDLQNYEAIFSYIYALKKTELLIQEFLKDHHLFHNKEYESEGEEICTRVLQAKNKVVEAIEGFAMGDPVPVGEKLRLQELAAEMPDLVENFIKRVTSQLPTGGDLNLLIIGKTGHGKSSTANTILRRKEFAASSGGVSETKSCQQGLSELDGRRFNVVDVPGVCDTDLDSVESVNLAVKCISEAISMVSEGFHALLLVIRYGNRMTEEEERAIYILKCILGQAVVNSHCICVVTHGDNFEDTEGSFQDWCKRQVGFLKEIFEECNYRCVLFNNKTSDPVILKTQLIELVSKVDRLEHKGACYTNEIFKHAEKDRQRLVEKLELPQFKEQFMRDLNLLQDDFEDIEKTAENERQSKLEELKSRTESFRLRLDQVQCGGIADLYQAVSNFSERLHRQEEKELADAQLRLEREKSQQAELKLKEEIEAKEKELAEQTPIPEPAPAAAPEPVKQPDSQPHQSKWVKFRKKLGRRH